MLVKQILSLCAVLSPVVLALPAATVEAQVAELTVGSAAFADGEAIPIRNSAYGDNLSPGIMRSGTPEGTEAFALELVAGLSRDAVMSAIEGHIIGEGQVTGIFERER